jgi:hypothetical protein
LARKECNILAMDTSRIDRVRLGPSVVKTSYWHNNLVRRLLGRLVTSSTNSNSEDLEVGVFSKLTYPIESVSCNSGAVVHKFTDESPAIIFVVSRCAKLRATWNRQVPQVNLFDASLGD